MSKLRVHSFGMSIDGYGAGSNQRLENPLGIGGLALHEWAFKTPTFHSMVGEDGGETGVDDDFVARGFDNVGAWIIGGMPLGWGDLLALGYQLNAHTNTASCMHVLIAKQNLVRRGDSNPHGFPRQILSSSRTKNQRFSGVCEE